MIKFKKQPLEKNIKILYYKYYITYPASKMNCPTSRSTLQNHYHQHQARRNFKTKQEIICFKFKISLKRKRQYIYICQLEAS